MEYSSASDAQESIEISSSINSVITGTTCNGPRLLYINFRDSFDMSLGRYLKDVLLDQTNCCLSCREPTEAHIISYTHHLVNFTINVNRVPSLKLGGEDDGKIWTCHRCLICEQIYGIPPATRRAVMSGADLELSFRKFLELGFSNYANPNHLASCGHSLQRDCLQYYGFGSMVVFFQYSNMDQIQFFSVCLPSSTIDFNVSATSLLTDGARLKVPQTSKDDIIVAAYDNEPTGIISYALASKEYEDQIGINASDADIEISESYNAPAQQSYGSEDVWNTSGSISVDQKTSPHLTISFGDESADVMGKKFSVTCYFAKQFDALRKICCPAELDFIYWLSRCHTQGGKDNAYFAKSLDERFIVKQITKTELGSFQEFAAEYFKYLTDSLCYRSTTCLTKILGIYQISHNHSNGDKEIKMDLMVMENLFFKRKIYGFYSIKDSARSHCCISNTEDANGVLLDMNVSKTIPTIPILLGSKEKRTLQRAVWNDSAFLASVNVADYFLLVGVDEECQELVVGIIDFMTHHASATYLETWIKAFCILGGTESAAIASPKLYKQRFRKVVTSSFPLVPVP